MKTIEITIVDSKHERLKQYTKKQGVSLNELFDEFATVALAQFDVKTRFTMITAKGDTKRGIEILDKLDKNLK